MALKRLKGVYYDTDNPNDVAELQQGLQDEGYDVEVDGVYGPQTEAAYNQASGGTPDGGNVNNPSFLGPYGGPPLQSPSDSMYPNANTTQSGLANNPTLNLTSEEYDRNRAAGMYLTDEERAAANAEEAGLARELQYAQRRDQLVEEGKRGSARIGVEAAALVDERKKGFLGRIKGVGLKFLDAVGKPFEEVIAQPYYAGKRAELTGGNLATQVGATLGGLPGLGGLARGQARKAIEETNSYEERANLTREGGLASFGEFVSGRAKEPGKLKPELAKRLPRGQVAKPIRGLVSGGLDLGLNVVGDPVNLLLPGATSLGKAASGAGLKAAASAKLAAEGAGFGRRALEFTTGGVARGLRGTAEGTAGQQALRASVARGRLGAAAIDAAVEAVRKGARDVTELSKRVGGLEGPAAQRILDAARTGTLDDVRAAITREFVAGTWDPKLGTLRKLSGAVGGVGVSGGIVKSGKVAAVLRRAARGDGVALATGLSRDAGQVLERTLQRASERGQTFVGDVRSLVDPALASMTPDARAASILALADTSGNAAFRDAVHAEVGRAYRSTDQAEVTSILERLETTQAILDGKAGGAARTQAEAELRQGFAQTLDTSSGRKIAETARRNTGLAAPSKNALAAYDGVLKKGGKDAVSDLRKTIRRAGLEPKIQAALLEDLRVAVKAKKGLGRVASDFDILRSPEVGAEAKRLVQNVGERAKQAEVRLSPNGLGSKVKATAAKLPLSFMESISPSSIAFEGGATTTQQILHRVEGADRWAADMGLDDMARNALRQAAEAAKTEGELYKAVANAVRLFAVGEGIDPDLLEAMYRGQYAAFKRGDGPKRVFGVDANGEKITENIFTKAQLVEQIPLPDPGDLRHSARKLRAGDGADELRSLHAAGESMGNTLLGQVLKKGHRLWKFSIVSNIFLPVVGAAAGFGTGEGWDDRLKRGAQGFGIGLLGPARYVLRVAVLEESLRKYMDQGFVPSQWIPGLAKWSATRGVDRPFVSEHIVHASKVLDRLVGGKLLSTATNDYVSLGKNDTRFVDAWWRVVNRQISPETDEITRIILNEKAGVFTTAQATDEVKKFLKTAEGKVIRERLASGTGGTGSINIITDRYRQFIDAYITDPDLARARLQVGDKRLAGEIHAEVDRKVLKQATKSGMSPDYVHAQQSWVVPKSARQVVGTFNTLLAKAVFEGPTSTLNRVPLARKIYKDEYLRLVNNGVDPKEAQEIADAIAVRRTNKVMFQMNDESRFAKKADYIFPFQQPREEMFRVWLPLVKANPGRAMKMTRLAALAFNNGQESGAFRKDESSGEWVMSVPHSAWLGDKLFGGLPGFEANLKDLLLPAQGAFSPGRGIIPNPGGPWFTTAAKFWANNHPEAFKDMPDMLKGLMFPYGLKGNLMRPEAARLWMGMTGSVPPWEFASTKDQQDELDKWQKRLYKEMKFDHWKKTGDTEWEPSDDEMKKAFRSFMSMWSVVSSTFPASPHPITPGSREVSKVIEANTHMGKVDWDKINKDFPILSIYMTSESKYVGPQDYDSWLESDPDWRKRGEQSQLGLRRQLTLDEFKDVIADGQRRSKAYKEWGNVFAKPGNSWEREANLQAWREKYPDLAAEQRDDYFRKEELHKILSTYPRHERDEAIDRWRQTYDVSVKEYHKLRKDVEENGFQTSAWKSARFSEDVAADVALKVRQGINEEVYVATLNPAEQVGYWKSKQAALNDYDGDNPQRVLDDYRMFGQYVSNVYEMYPELANGVDTMQEKMVARFIGQVKGDVGKHISEGYDEAERLKVAMDHAAKTQQWVAFYEMKAKRDVLFEEIKQMKNSMHNKIPAFPGAKNELEALMLFGGEKGVAAIKKFASRPESGAMPWILDDEQASYLNKPVNVQKAFVADLVQQVSQESGTTGKLFWQWLTDFQRDLLEKNLTPQQIYAMQRDLPGGPSSGGGGSGDAKGFKWVQVNGKWVLYYKGNPFNSGGGSGGFGGKFYGDNDTIGNGAGDLAFALEKFAQYSKRATGAVAPATYDEYIKLPANPAVRAAYLKEHPEVGEWIKTGPLANMPALERYMVTNIMIKYGKWEGELKTNEEILDLSFAREQMKRWNRRPEGASAPENYDIWLNMPPGKEKSAYMKAHPEIKDWISLGPMANMPDEYQTVVRDIMFRYGEWTQNQDPMGVVISEYYKLPAYARKKFLLEHPELEDYWAAYRSPEEERMFQLSQQYFSMQSSTAKKALLSANPDLQQHFLDARNKRYEKFLNQVAQFMGGNPEMFKGYLDRQNDILAELLRRYASPNLLREAPGIKKQTTQGVKARGKAA